MAGGEQGGFCLVQELGFTGIGKEICFQRSEGFIERSDTEAPRESVIPYILHNPRREPDRYGFGLRSAMFTIGPTVETARLAPFR